MKLAELQIKNFGCIDDAGYKIRIDNIVILIGPNNVGKSLVLDAYEAFASMGAALPISKFRDENQANAIEIVGIFTEITPDDTELIGQKWAHDDAEYGTCVKVRFLWTAAEAKAQKYSWDAEKDDWERGGMGGFDSLLSNRIPEPLRIRPTDAADVLEKQIVSIFVAEVKSLLKKDDTPLAGVFTELERLAGEFGEKVQTELSSICEGVGEKLKDIFPGHQVKFEPSIGKFDAEKVIGSGSHIKISREDSSIYLSEQGTGLQRAFLWSALGTLAELGLAKRGKTVISSEKPRILLIDEPESFLHPPLIRKAREALYKLASVDGWQIMGSTHSSVLIDVSKPHTTIVRIANDNEGRSRTFATDQTQFTPDEKKQLQMVRACHPTVNEFFFADHVFLVEGETEHAVLCILLAEHLNEENSPYHIVNCMGKGNLPMFARILNQFGTPYTVIHDADSPRSKYKKTTRVNGMWTVNDRIIQEVGSRQDDLPQSYLVVHVPDFEGYYFGKTLSKDKPYYAIQQLQREDFESSPEMKPLRELPSNLVNNDHPGKYETFDELIGMVEQYKAENNLNEDELWIIEN